MISRTNLLTAHTIALVLSLLDHEFAGGDVGDLSPIIMSRSTALPVNPLVNHHPAPSLSICHVDSWGAA